MKLRHALIASVLTLLACEDTSAPAAEVRVQEAELTKSPKPSIVLIHGAWADGSGFQFVIPPLERAGYHVTAAQLPLTSVADDVAVVRRIVDSQPGEVLLVAHSYGGVAMSAVSYQNPKVIGLVYLASFAPDDGEVLGGLLAREPGELMATLRPDAGGFLSIDRAEFGRVFANGVLPTLSRVLAAAQKPINPAIFTQSIEHAGWHEVPSFYLLSTEDRTIPPALQRFMADRIGAQTSEIQAGHLAFISRPYEVVKFILGAARSL